MGRNGIDSQTLFPSLQMFVEVHIEAEILHLYPTSLGLLPKVFFPFVALITKRLAAM